MNHEGPSAILSCHNEAGTVFAVWLLILFCKNGFHVLPSLLGRSRRLPRKPNKEFTWCTRPSSKALHLSAPHQCVGLQIPRSITQMTIPLRDGSFYTPSHLKCRCHSWWENHMSFTARPVLKFSCLHVRLWSHSDSNSTPQHIICCSHKSHECGYMIVSKDERAGNGFLSAARAEPLMSSLQSPSKSLLRNIEKF